MACLYRIPNRDHWPERWVNQIIQDDAFHAVRQLPDECVALAVTSPPYWNVMDYGKEGQIGQSSYEQYLQDLLPIWRETARVLIPNGKLAVVAPIMPLPKKIFARQHTRHLKNISSDIEHTILSDIKELERFSLFVWQKQTTVKMFGSYPFPPNIFEDNTIEFINVFVKEGIPPSLPKAAKIPSRLTQEEWRNLSMQVWPIYPADVKRAGGHPCPFPLALPLRLIRMYTFRQALEAGFAGDIVLDMFNGAGASCVAAKAAGRNWIGVDLNPDYCSVARARIENEAVDSSAIFLEPPRVRNPKNQSGVTPKPNKNGGRPSKPAPDLLNGF